MSAEFPVRAKIDSKDIDVLIELLRKGGKQSKLTEEEIKKLEGSVKELGNKGPKEVKKVNESLDQVGKVANRVQGAIMAVFSIAAIKKVAEMSMELAKLAGEARGVRTAFNQIPEAEVLMGRLKRATGGMVSELDLMKKSVEALNFGASMDNLGQMFEFATMRAASTGQEVGALVDQIVKGIGTESPRAFAQLGISQTRLREEMARTNDFSSAVLKIMQEEIERVGEIAENTSDKSAKLAASWQNFRLAMGESVDNSGVVGGAFDYLSGLLDVLASKNLNASDKLIALSSTMGMVAAKAKDLSIELGKDNALKAFDALVLATGDLDEAHKQYTASIEAELEVMRAQRAELMRAEKFNKEEDERLLNRIKWQRELVASIDEYVRKKRQQLEQDKVEVPLIEKLQKEIEKEKALRDSAVNYEQLSRHNIRLAKLQEEMDILMSLGKSQMQHNELLRKYYETLREINEQQSKIRFNEDDMIKLLDEKEKKLQEQIRLHKELDSSIADMVMSMELQEELADKMDAELERRARRRIGWQQYMAQHEMDLALETFGFMMDLQATLTMMQANNYRARMMMLEEERNREVELAGDNAEAREKIQKDFDKKIGALRVKEAQKQREAALINIATDTAIGVVRALSQPPGPPFTIPFGVLMGAQGLLQAAIVRSQPLPRFAGGVYGLNGPGTEKSDSIPAMLSRNESVVPASQSKAFGWLLKPMIEEHAFNEQKLIDLVMGRVLPQYRGDLFDGPRVQDKGSDRLERKLDEVVVAIRQGNRQRTTGFGPDGVSEWVRHGDKWTEYVNTRYRV